jgi:hypothetical protein
VWEPNAPRPLGKGFALRAGKESAEWGYHVLIRVEVIARYGYLRGFRIRGTVEGEPFMDEVDSYTVFCGDSESVTTACDRYNRAHDYA